MNTHDNDSEGYLIPENKVDNKIGYAKMVKAHVMHRHLQLQQDFDTWFNDHVEKLELKKGVHFVFTKKRRKAKKGLSKI